METKEDRQIRSLLSLMAQHTPACLIFPFDAFIQC